MLTAKTIATAQEGATLWDKTARGLHLRVRKSGKAFFFYYRTKEGQERRPKIGDVGTVTLEQARGKAKEWAAIVALGGDPMADRTVARAEPTVAELADKYLAEYAVKKKSHAKDKAMVDLYVKPKLGGKRVKAVEYSDIDAIHKSLESKPFAANRVLALLSKMFNLAERWQYRAQHTNPCRHVQRYPEPKRKVYVKSDEAPRIAAVLAKYEATRPQAVLFTYLLILSGARPDEISRARPDQVEPRPLGGVLRLQEHKTDGTGSERMVYLPPQVMDLIKKYPGTADSLTGIKSPKALWGIIRKEANVPHLRLYDLRHTFASAALKAGYTLAQIGELLGHASTQTTSRYAHIMDEMAQTAAAETAAVLERMMNASTTEAKTG